MNPPCYPVYDPNLISNLLTLLESQTKPRASQKQINRCVDMVKQHISNNNTACCPLQQLQQQQQKQLQLQLQQLPLYHSIPASNVGFPSVNSTDPVNQLLNAIWYLQQQQQLASHQHQQQQQQQQQPLIMPPQSTPQYSLPVQLPQLQQQLLQQQQRMQIQQLQQQQQQSKQLEQELQQYLLSQQLQLPFNGQQRPNFSSSFSSSSNLSMPQPTFPFKTSTSNPLFFLLFKSTRQLFYSRCVSTRSPNNLTPNYKKRFIVRPSCLSPHLITSLKRALLEFAKEMDERVSDIPGEKFQFDFLEVYAAQTKRDLRVLYLDATGLHFLASHYWRAGNSSFVQSLVSIFSNLFSQNPSYVCRRTISSLDHEQIIISQLCTDFQCDGIFIETLPVCPKSTTLLSNSGSRQIEESLPSMSHHFKEIHLCPGAQLFKQQIISFPRVYFFKSQNSLGSIMRGLGNLSRKLSLRRQWTPQQQQQQQQQQQEQIQRQSSSDFIVPDFFADTTPTGQFGQFELRDARGVVLPLTENPM